MSMSITIGGNAVIFDEDSWQLHPKADERWRCQFTVLDYAGTQVFTQYQQVVVTDPGLGNLFTGFVIDVKKDKSNVYPDPTIEHQIDCIGLEYLAGKRTTNRLYSNPTLAGKIAVDMLADVLSEEGVTANYAQHFDTSASDFSAGTLTNLVGVSNVDDGDLELSPAGSAISVLENTTSAFAAGTLTGVTASNNTLVQTPFNVVKITGVNSITSAGNTYTYHKIWSGSYTVPAAPNSGFFIYDMFVLASSPEIKIAIDFVCSDGTTWRDNATEFDTQHQKPHPATDLSGLADGKWYHRDFGIQTFAGKTISYVSVAIEGDATGTYTGYFRNIFIANASRVSVQDIFRDATTALNTNQQLQNYGYSSTVVSVAQCYDPFDTRISPSYSIDAAKISASNFISWTTTQTDTGGIGKRNGSYISVGYSIDAGASYIICSNNAPLPDFPPGLSVAGKSIQFVQFLTSNPQNPEDSPTLNSFSFSLTPGYNGTKADALDFVDTNSAWAAGTFSNTTNNSGPTLSLSGAIRNWDNADSSNQPLFGGTGAEIFTSNKNLVLGVDASNDARSQMTFAGQFQNFACEVDILVSSNYQIGLVWRTTNWNNGNNTFGYAAMVTPTSVVYGRGSNSGSSGSFTTIATSAALTLTSGQRYRFKVFVNGTSCITYINDVQMTSATDATFSAAGYIGLRIFNSSGSHQQAQFDNFGVTSALSGTWLSPSISLNALGTYAASDFYYADVSTDHSNCSLLAEYTINGGSTWTTISNPMSVAHTFGGPLPGLSVGQSLAGVSLQIRFTLTTTTTTAQPQVNAVVLKILGGFSASGTRSTAPIGNDTFVRANVGSGWGTSFDSQTYTQVGTGTTNLTSNEGQIVNTTGDVHMVLGSTTWTDEEGTCRFALSASTISGGMELRYVDANNFYRLSLSTTSISIIKRSGGTSYTLVTATIALSTSAFYRMRFRVVGSSLVSLFGKVWLDGTLEPTTWSVTTVD